MTRYLDALAKDMRFTGGEIARHAVAMRIAELGRNDEIHHRLAEQVVAPVPEGAFRGGVELQDAAFVVDGNDAIDGNGDHRRAEPDSGKFCFQRAPTSDELANLPADAVEGGYQRVAPLFGFGAEQLDHANELITRFDRKRQGAVQPRTGSVRCTRKILQRRNVALPGGVPRFPNDARQTDPALHSHVERGAGERRGRSGSPQPRRPQHSFLAGLKPERSERPPQLLGDRRQRTVDRFADRVGCGQRLADGIFQLFQPGAHCCISRGTRSSSARRR